MTSVLNNEIKFNVLCHSMAKDNLSLAYRYITDIFNDSMSHKDRCTKTIKTSLLIVRSFLLCIPCVNRITQFALRLLSPKITMESLSYFGIEELEIRYSTELFLFYSSKGSQTTDSKGVFICDQRERQHQIIEILKCIEGFEELKDALRLGPFRGLNQEGKKQMWQMFFIFLENPQGFESMLQNASLQSQKNQQDFSTFIDNVFIRLFQDQQDLSEALSEENQQDCFELLSEEEKSNFNNLIKEIELNKNLERFRATET